MGHGGVRQRDHDVHQPDLPARRRVPVRPADLRALRRLLGAEERARAAAEDPGNHQITDALNTKPKYLVSNTLTEPRWANTTVLSGDVAAAIGELKAKPGGELQVHGSGALIRWLLEHDLVDEVNLLIVPVVLGQGARLFPDAGPDIALDLVESRADSKGVTIQVYRPTGRPRYATATTRHDDE